MSFEITPEVAESLNLTPEQLTGLTDFGSKHFNSLQDQWNNDLETKINERTNSTFEGATKKIEKESGIPRISGEIASEYMKRVNETAFSEMRSKAEKALSDSEQRLLDAQKDGASKAELERLQGLVDTLQVKEAEYDKLTDQDVVGKLEEANSTISSLREKLAFGDVKPAFSQDTNKYESDAKWNQFISETKAKGDLVEVDEVWFVADKDNPHKTKKISDLVAETDYIQGLITGRQQDGTGATPVPKKNFDGVPFSVPEKATDIQRQEAITKYLVGEGVQRGTDKWLDEYEKYNNILRKNA